MHILIDKVRILNYRSIKKCSVDLTQVTVLIGANNSGKTSLLRALNLALGVGVKRVSKEDFYIGTEGNNNEETEIIVDVRLIPVDTSGQRLNEFDQAWRERQFGELINIDEHDKEYFAFRTKIKYDLLKGDYLIKKYKVKDWKDEPDWENQKHEEDLKQSFDGFPLFFIDAQRDIIQDLRDRSSYFGRLINKIKIDERLIKEIEEKIKAINDSIVNESDELAFLRKELLKPKDTITTGSEIEINPINKKLRDISRGININLQDTASESFPLDYHGMGTRSWASLLTYGAFISWQYKKLEAENQPYHAILALEEPEAHLHPQAQRTLYKQLSEMEGQKIISTHSPFITSQCQLNEIRHFKKQKSYTEIKSLDMSSLIEEDKRKLRREVLNTRGELLFARAVVLFEGETEEQALPIFAEKHWGKHPYEMGISFVGVGGHNYTPFLRLISSFNLSGFVFSDGEEKTIKEVKKQIDEIFKDKSTEFVSNFVMTIPDNYNFEKYLIHNGFADSIENAVKWIEGQGYITNYIQKNQGKSI
ncbi:MAG TPA: AAA family ATPase, partial [Thermodesulfovibrionia bacterium]|nr:AAA family ATPase [Thermodesulfovibrionia bacterium]